MDFMLSFATKILSPADKLCCLYKQLGPSVGLDLDFSFNFIFFKSGDNREAYVILIRQLFEHPKHSKLMTKKITSFLH